MKRNARKTVQINLKVTADVKARLERLARQLDCGMVDVVEVALEKLEAAERDRMERDVAGEYAAFRSFREKLHDSNPNWDWLVQ